MIEKLKKIEPYVYYPNNNDIKLRFQCENIEIYFEFEMYDGEYVYAFYLEEDGNALDGFNFNNLYKLLKEVERDFKTIECYTDKFRFSQLLSDDDKSILLKMLYYILTDYAYLLFEKKSNEAEFNKIKKNTKVLLLDILTDDNPYLPIISDIYIQK